MGFNELKKEKLEGAAEYFAVDIENCKTKADIIEALKEDGVTFESYEEFLVNEPPAEEQMSVQEFERGADEVSEKIVLRHTRNNLIFETHGYKFTRSNPYVAMPSNVAQQILDAYPGRRFEVASPREVKEFYS